MSAIDHGNAGADAGNIIRRLGGHKHLSRMLGVSEKAVHQWRVRGRIPLWHRPRLLRYAAEHRIPLVVEDFGGV